MQKVSFGNYVKMGVFSLLFSLIPATIIASAYLTFHDGFSKFKIDNFDFMLFLQESPFVKGYLTTQFQTSLYVFAVVVVIFLILGLALAFPKKSNSHGSAKWADFGDLAKKGYIKPHKEIVGSVFGKTSSPKSSGKYLTNAGQPHTLVSAPTRAGKGVGVVIPTLLTFNGSAVVLDVKGELFDFTSRFRQNNGDQIFRFSPLDPDGRTHCYNPLDAIVRTPENRRFTECRRLAANLITAKNKGAEGFLDGARDIFAAGIMAAIEEYEHPTIGDVYDLINAGGNKAETFGNLADRIVSPEAKGIFSDMSGNDNKILSSYTSVLGDGGLKLWADHLVRAATSKSDFDINRLRYRPMTIYLCVPPNDLEVLAPLMRLLFQQIVASLQSSLPTKDEIFEVLFLLDEFKSLGRLDLISQAITTIAGYGGRFMFIVQNLANIKEIYGKEGAENFLGNTGLQVYMATSDADTPEYISKSIGDYTRTSRSKSWKTGDISGKNIQEREEGSRLIRPEEIRLLPEDEQIVLIKGESPLKMPKIKYYQDRILKRIFESQDGELPLPPVPDSALQKGIETIPDLPQEVVETRISFEEGGNSETETEPDSEIHTSPPLQSNDEQDAFDKLDALIDVDVEEEIEDEEEKVLEFSKPETQAGKSRNMLDLVNKLQQENRD